MRRSAQAAAAITAVLAGAAVPAAASEAASSLVIKGRGFGHGIGMSQYGAYGYATHGFGYRDILGRYYTGTAVSQLSGAPQVRVLLQGARRVVVTGAARAAGARRLAPSATYTAVASGGRVSLRNARGKRVALVTAPLRLTAPAGGTLQLKGTAANSVVGGRYRGAIEVRPSGSRVIAVNAVGLEDYVRGVISAESPAGWPAEALKAQAVAARTYAVTTNAGTADDGFDQYADTRSQMYKGVAAEFPSTDAAVAATAGEVVTEGGRPVTTYFFSTSGGHTENIEFSFVGSLPKPWLKGVEDPFDDASPKHTWGPITLSAGRASAKLRGLVRGSFRGIKVLQRGTSPRIVRAEVVGTAGVTPVSGPELRRRFGLDDTWATFTFVSSKADEEKAEQETDSPTPEQDAAADPSGGVTASTSATRPRALTGAIDRMPAGASVRVQQRVHGGWLTVTRTSARAGGRYRAALPGPGTFRVLWGDVPGPAVDVR